MVENRYRYLISHARRFAVGIVFIVGWMLWTQAGTSQDSTPDSTTGVVAADFVAASISSGQYTQDQQAPSAPVPQSQSDKAEQQLQQQERQRILGIIPNFNTSNIPDAVPLSPRQKFQLAFRDAIDPFEFFAAGALAGWGQAENDNAGYGQGAQGYGKRYGAAYADSADGVLWGNAIFPVLLHEDPRYFRKATGSFWGRFRHAVLTTVWTKNDNGTFGPNYANVLGNVVAGGISNLYYPSDNRGVGLTFEGAATVTAEGALGALGVEFWPDVSSRLFHKRNHVPPAPSPK